MKNIKFIISILFISPCLCNYIILEKKDKNIVATIEYKGMNLVAPIKELKNKTFDELKNNNINSVSLIPYAFVNLEKITIDYDNGKQWWGETSEGIRACVKQAHAYNLKTMLKPHLWVNNNTFTGHLDFKSEKDWQKWEAVYEKYILNFAKIAQSEKVALFCIGTELKNPVIKRPKYWLKLIKQIRHVYKGKLTYAANWDEFHQVTFWEKLDYIGIDAYFPLSKSKTPSIQELNLNWKTHISRIEKIQKKYNKLVILTEFGYRNSDYCADKPWEENNASVNEQAQANSYEALFQSFKNKSWYKGGFVWKWYPDNYYKKYKIDYTPQEKLALKTIELNYR